MSRTGCSIGNDVVDLAEAGVAGKERDVRFMARVFTPAERARILAAAVPTLALWKTWSAKETAYKVACKIRGRLVFAHRAFEVVMDRPQEGLVRFGDLLVHVRWQLGAGCLHCLGFHSADAGRVSAVESGFRRIDAEIADLRQALAGTLTAAERGSVHSAASERARLLARQILERWGRGAAEIVRRRRPSGWGAPVVAYNGRRVEGFDVSLSHDGRFVAAAVSGPLERV